MTDVYVIHGGHVEFHIFIALTDDVEAFLANVAQRLGLDEGAFFIPHKVVEERNVVHIGGVYTARAVLR